MSDELKPPIPMPAPPAGYFHSMDAVSDARDNAMGTRFLAAGEYATANYDYSQDVQAYNEANAMWAQRSNVIEQANQQHWQDCNANMQAAYAKLGLESASVNLAYNRIGEGDGKVAQGDMTPPNSPATKIGFYNEGEGKFGESRTASAAAAQRHGEFVTPITNAMAILQLYG